MNHSRCLHCLARLQNSKARVDFVVRGLAQQPLQCCLSFLLHSTFEHSSRLAVLEVLDWPTTIVPLSFELPKRGYPMMAILVARAIIESIPAMQFDEAAPDFVFALTKKSSTLQAVLHLLMATQLAQHY